MEKLNLKQNTFFESIIKKSNPNYSQINEEKFIESSLCSLYADHTATGRPYSPIEEHIYYDIKPFIANSHTETSELGKFSTILLNYSEESILQSFNVSKKTHFAVPAGYGATGAFERLIKILRFDKIVFNDIKLNDSNFYKRSSLNIPVIFITPYEHHSNILPWVNDGCKVVIVDSDSYGNINTEAFRNQLNLHKNYKNQLVSFSAASNVTSQHTPLTEINRVIQEHKTTLSKKDVNFYFAVDGAAFCSHDRLDLRNELNQLDFLCLSPHKNLGGNEATGVLIMKNSSYSVSKPPSFPGGGTVLAVTSTNIKNIFYDTKPNHREMPGTPDTIGFYRAALTFQLQDFISLVLIRKREKENALYFYYRICEINANLYKNKNTRNASIEILGDPHLSKRFGVFSFNIYSEFEEGCGMTMDTEGRYLLHPHFVAKLLNDFFGIQVRSGCSCAGPFGVKLLHISDETAQAIAEKVALEGREDQKPGWVRLDTNFLFQKYEIEYIIKALKIIAVYGNKIQDFYEQSIETGQFRLKYSYEPTYIFGMKAVLF